MRARAGTARRIARLAPTVAAVLLAGCAASPTSDAGDRERGRYGVRLFGVGLDGVARHDGLYGGGLGFDAFLDDHISLGFEVAGYEARQDEQIPDRTATSAAVFGRYWIEPRSAPAFYVEVGSGGIVLKERFPTRRGTRFNFITQVGTGMRVELSDDLGLLLGVRYAHVSNADLKGDERNPGFDGLGGMVGIALRF